MGERNRISTLLDGAGISLFLSIIFSYPFSFLPGPLLHLESLAAPHTTLESRRGFPLEMVYASFEIRDKRLCQGYSQRCFLSALLEQRCPHICKRSIESMLTSTNKTTSQVRGRGKGEGGMRECREPQNHNETIRKGIKEQP